MEIFKIRITFAKKGLMRFISHLDLVRLFSRALRRAQLPIKYTSGFNPHPKLSFKRALKLGLESENEEFIVHFKEDIKLEELRSRFQQQLPEGIELRKLEYSYVH